jgi:autotransporter translocation and assembly factor TamB
LVIILILVIGILAFIQTPFAKRKIGEVITSVTRTSDGGEVFFGSISGLIPYRIRVGDFRIRDGEGDWLVVKDADVRVSLPDLIRFRLRALEVKVGSASLLRLPRGNKQKEKEKTGDDNTPFSLLSLPSFSVDLLSVDRATVEEPVLGERIVTSLKGYRIKTNTTDGGTIHLSLIRIDGKSGRLTMSAASGPEFSPLFTRIWIEEDEGESLEELLSSGSTGSLFLFFKGQGPIEKWKVDLTARREEEWKLTGGLVLDLTRPLAEGKLEATFETLPMKEMTGRGTVSTNFTVAGGGQNIAAEIQAETLELPFGRAGGLEVTVDVKDILRSPRGTVKFNAANLHYPAAEDDEAGVAITIGKITGDLSLRGTDQQPAAELEVRITDCTFPNAPTGSLEPLEISISGGLNDDRIRLSLDSGEQSRFAIKAEVEAEVKASLNPISFDLTEDGTISGKLQARIDLELLSNRLAISRQTIRGIVNADLTAAGTIGEPELTGEVRMEKGRYRNLNTGTALNSVTVDLLADRDRITIRQLSATTPGHGKLGLSGELNLSPADNFPYSFSLDLDSAEVIDLEELTAIVSGKVRLEGSAEEGSIQGTINIDQADGRIPKTFPPSIPEIEVEEINRPGGVSPVQKPSGPCPFLEKFSLDLLVTAPEKISVKGRGLDSEWRANISVKGTAARPLVSGGVELLDGIFIFMGEELDMKDCSLTMDGRFPPVPQLKINMERVKSDITINLQIVGPITAPEVILSSQPPYPTDEILAQLLYGRSSSQLTGMQALQIANGLRTLQGKGGFFDLLTGWTSFLGDIQVDLTDLEGSTDQTAVRVRWSVNRHIYVENQRAIDDKGNVFIARWDLTRHLQLNTQSGYGLLGDSAYLRYRWDY